MAQINQLSNREWEVMNLLLQGKSNKIIASSLGISVRTVEFHLKNIYAKFKVNSRIELILKLGSATGKFEIKKPGYSTVDRLAENTDNKGEFNPRLEWITSFIRGNRMTRKCIIGVLAAITLTLFLFGNIATAASGVAAAPAAVQEFGGYEPAALTVSSASFGYNFLYQFAEVEYRLRDTSAQRVKVSLQRFSFFDNWRVMEFVTQP